MTTRNAETRTYRITTSQAAGYGVRLITLPIATAELYARLWVDAGHTVEVVG